MAVILGETMAARMLAVVRRSELAPRGTIGRAQGPRPQAGGGMVRQYFTTGSGLSPASHSGSTVSDFKHVAGSGTARRCKQDGSGNVIPDPGLEDETVFNDVEAAVGPGFLIDCVYVHGQGWTMFLKDRCS